MKKNPTIAVIDYGLGNLYSIYKALSCFTDNVVITSNPSEISEFDGLVLPGVGSFLMGMQGLQERKLVEPIRKFPKSGKPILGICLGAQLLLSRGYEIREYDGLDIISGDVKIFSDTVADKVKVPHIGWNTIIKSNNYSSWGKTIFENINEESSVYFVHSYIMMPSNKDNIIVSANYGGLEFCAAINDGNIYGTQFHPEKSGEIGLSMIKNFVNIC